MWLLSGAQLAEIKYTGYWQNGQKLYVHGTRGLAKVSDFVHGCIAPSMCCLLTCVSQTNDTHLVIRRQLILYVLQVISKNKNIWSL